MPFIAMLHMLIAIGFALHAHKTGRPQIWMYILLFVPLVGAVAYVLFELLPELANSRRGRQVGQDMRTLVDPHRDWRQRAEKVAASDTVDAKCKFAEECEKKGMWAEAIDMYQKAAVGLYAEDPDVLRGLARAHLGADDAVAAEVTLDTLRRAHPDYQNQDAHLTYARALEAQDRLSAAEEEYKALSAYFVGMEARARYGLLLQKLGEPAAAKTRFEEVIKASKARGVVLSAGDRDWVKVAQRNV